MVFTWDPTGNVRRSHAENPGRAVHVPTCLLSSGASTGGILVAPYSPYLLGLFLLSRNLLMKSCFSEFQLS